MRTHRHLVIKVGRFMFDCNHACDCLIHFADENRYSKTARGTGYSSTPIGSSAVSPLYALRSISTPAPTCLNNFLPPLPLHHSHPRRAPGIPLAPVPLPRRVPPSLR